MIIDPELALKLRDAAAQTTQNEVIRFVSFDILGPPPEEIVLTPSSENWPEVVKKLSGLGVETWEASYSELNVLDGHGWSLTIQTAKISLQSSGSNAYPPNFEAVKEVIEGAAGRSDRIDPVPPKPPAEEKPTRFQGTVMLSADRPARDTHQIVEAIVE